MESESKCPFSATLANTRSLEPLDADWWPNQLKLNILHQHSSKSDPMGEEFNYAESSRGST